MEKVICPYCGEVLRLYEVFSDYNNSADDTLNTEEHYECLNCDRCFSRNVNYKVVEKGMLEE